MRKNHYQILFGVLMLLFVSLSCNLPDSEQKTAETLFPATPNATMTALFAQATVLTPEFAASATFIPTEEIVLSSPTSTVEPTATITETEGPTVTNTSDPNHTNTPPPTLTVPARARSNGYFVASYLSSPPVIDGEWSDWSTVEYPAGNVVFGHSEWDNDDDLEAAFRIGWDYTYLYVAVKVKDDVYVQNATGLDMWQGDSIELQFDKDLYSDFYYTALSADDYQLALSPGKPDTNGSKEAYLYLPRSIAGSRAQVSVASVSSSGLYRLEAAIPWSVFGVSPQMNDHFGFALSVSDNDTAGTIQQQSMVSSTPGRMLTNPTTWSELVLGN